MEVISGHNLASNIAIEIIWKNKSNWPVSFVSENISQFGYTAEDFASGKLSFIDIIDKTDKKYFASILNNCTINTDVCLFTECKIIDIQKKRRWIAVFIYTKKQECTKYVHATIIDITANKFATSPLNNEYEYLRNIINGVNESLLILNYNLDVICANNSYYRLFRAKKSNIENNNLFSIENGQWNVPLLKDKLKFLINNNIEIQNLELNEYFNQLGFRSIFVNAKFILTLNNSDPLIMFSIEDASETKKAAKKLAISEAKYATLVEKGNDGIIIIQKKMLKFVNTKFLKMTGYENSEAINSLLIDYVPEEFKRMLLNRYEKTLKTQHNIKRNYEIEILKCDNTTFPTEITFSFIHYENQPSVMITIRDITERKKSEKELKNSEKKYSTLVEQSNDAIIILQDNYIVFVNNKFAEITGYGKTEAVGKLFSSFLSAESRRVYAKKLHRNLYATLETLHQREIELFSKYGGKIPVIITASIIDHEGKTSLMAIIRDITEQKIKEQKLLKLIEVQRLLENIIETSPTVVFIWKPFKDRPVDFVSENVSQFGYTVQDFTSGNMLFTDIIHPSDLQKVNSEIAKCLEHADNDISIEYRILTKNGQIRWLDERSIIKRDQNNIVEFIQGIVVDITERKTVNNFMRIGEELGSLNIPALNINELFRQSLEIVTQVKEIDSGMLYLIDEVTGDLNLVEYTGLSTKFVNNNKYFNSKSLYARILKTEYPVYKLYSEISYMSQMKDSGSEGLEGAAILPLKYKEEIVGVFLLLSHKEYSITENTRNILDNITAQIGPAIGRMRRYSSVHDSTQNLNVILNNIQVYIFVLDKNGCFLYVNDYFCNAVGYSSNNLMGMNILGIWPQKAVIAGAELISKVISGNISSTSITLESYNGELVNFDIHIKIDKWDNEKVVLFFGKYD